LLNRLYVVSNSSRFPSFKRFFSAFERAVVFESFVFLYISWRAREAFKKLDVKGHRLLTPHALLISAPLHIHLCSGPPPWWSFLFPQIHPPHPGLKAVIGFSFLNEGQVPLCSSDPLYLSSLYFFFSLAPADGCVCFLTARETSPYCNASEALFWSPATASG